MRVSQWSNPTPKPVDLNTRRNRTFPGNGLYLKGIVADRMHYMQPRKHDEHVMEMNEVRHFASGWVQRAATKVATMIDEPGPPTGHLAIPF
jgi:hypothetical protein